MSKWNIKIRDIFITPDQAFDDMKEIYGLDLRNAYDPCPFPESDVDGLTTDWGNVVTYVNPPFSKSLDWVLKAIQEAKKGADVYMMLPYYCWHDRTTTKWGNSAVTKHIKDYPYTKRYKYTFQSPIENQPPCKMMDVRFIHINKLN